MQELIGKVKLKTSTFQEKLLSVKLIFLIKVKFQMNLALFFTNTESKLASKIPNASTTFGSYINKPDSIMETKLLIEPFHGNL